MPVLAPGQPFEQASPVLLVENRLAAGRYRFRLTVTDDDGRESPPAFLDIEVRRRTRPPGPLDPLGPVGPIGPLDRDGIPRPQPRPFPRPR